jgi:hypothetical protein
MPHPVPQNQGGGQRKARRAALNEETDMTLNDYSYSWEYRTRSTELQDIAAMDRLAAEVAPASALRRYAASRRVFASPTGGRTCGGGAERAGSTTPELTP